MPSCDVVLRPAPSCSQAPPAPSSQRPVVLKVLKLTKRAPTVIRNTSSASLLHICKAIADHLEFAFFEEPVKLSASRSSVLIAVSVAFQFSDWKFKCMVFHFFLLATAIRSRRACHLQMHPPTCFLYDKTIRLSP
ncbi:hypothetical protein CDAR_594561 [Caerostris darwini]|uniref:Uncharacterized protein n=1 Tax=Caerostris darwini TaxID=1538125 RepID=A0AAV4WSV1_9ARAC|nr:hypothetical protein CDAR_594561 [Caerostris darwini]